jgi:hypothetical protein
VVACGNALGYAGDLAVAAELWRSALRGTKTDEGVVECGALRGKGLGMERFDAVSIGIP